MEYIPTQSDYDEIDLCFAWQEYEQRKFNVRCVNCGDTANETQKVLRLRGWELAASGEVCFRCNGRSI